MRSNLVIVARRPQDCSSAEIDVFTALVIEGGEVVSAGLRRRITQAKQLIFLYDGECVAITGIKNPNANYKAKVFKLANAEGSNKYDRELGWIYVKNEARGRKHANSLMEKALALFDKAGCFATAREDNDPMKYLLRKYGFTKLGSPYKSDSGDYLLGLYVAS